MRNAIWVLLLPLLICSVAWGQPAETKNKVVENIRANLKTGKFYINGSKESDGVNVYFNISNLSVSGDDLKYTWSYDWEMVISKPATCSTPHGCDSSIKGRATSSMSYAQAIKQLGENKILNMKIFTDESLKPLDSENCEPSNVSTNDSGIFKETNKCMAFVPYQVGSGGENAIEFRNLLKQLSTPALTTPDISTQNSNETDKSQIERINRLKRKIS